MRAILASSLLLAAFRATAEDDAAALALANQTTIKTETASPLRVFTEAAWADAVARTTAPAQRGLRLSLDVHYDQALTRELRVVFSNRLDARWQDGFTDENHVNTLKEAYLSWAPAASWIADVGRINVRNGVAFGYNPTDYFRAGAVRSIVSLDPASLRANRLGSVMLRNQFLWTDGSVTALYSPRITDQPTNNAFSPDFGATNSDDRWLVAASQKISDRASAQALTYGRAGRAPQFGLNLTALPTNAIVGYLEWSGGRAPSLASDALGLPADTAFRNRLATGFTYTTANKLSLTAEYQYNGTGFDRAGWDALRQQPLAYARYRSFAANVQDPPTKERVFMRAAWQDALLLHLDLTANVFFNTTDSSRQPWLEARYHWTRVDLALQWLWNSGAAGSEFGALPARSAWQAVLVYYF